MKSETTVNTKATHTPFIALGVCLLFFVSSTDGCVQTSVCVKKLSQQSSLHISFGAKTFKELVTNSDIFVDRSLLLKTVLYSPQQVISITYPRKWGKSVNLDMIREFLEINVNEDGNRVVSKNESSSYRLFKYGEIISPTGTVQNFNPPLLISKYENAFQKYQGKHPVIYLNLSELFNNNYAFMLKDLKNRIYQVFVKHDYMLKVFEKNLIDVENEPLEKVKVQVRRNFFRQILHKEALEKDIEESLVFLSKLLYEHFREKVFILIDGYDDVFRNLLFDSTATERAVRKMLTFFSSFYLRLFQNNEYLEKGIFTGLCSIIVDGLRPNTSLSNNIYKFENDLIQFYGFSKTDVDTIIDYLSLPKNAKEIANDWCGGYREGNRFADRAVHNPRCTINFLNQADFNGFCDQKYQTFSDNIDIVDEVLLQNHTDKFRNIILSLVRRQPIILHRSCLQFEEGNFFGFRSAVSLKKKLFKASTVVLSFLYMGGYLTSDTNPPKNSTTLLSTLRLPNKEMMKEMSQKLMVFVEVNYGVSQLKIEEVASNLVKCIESDDGNYYFEETRKVLEEVFRPVCLTTFKKSQRMISLLIPLILARIPLYIIGSEIFHTQITDGILVKDKQAIFLSFRQNAELSSSKDVFQKSKEDFKRIMIKKGVKNESYKNFVAKFVAINFTQNGTVLISVETKQTI